MKKVVIAGGTGFIGTYLNTRFREIGYKVLVVSRNSENVSWNQTELIEAFEGSELVINLAGKTINCRHTVANKALILESRIESTRLIGNAILACKVPPKLWLNASATGIYKSSLDFAMTEDETELGTDFLADVVTQWENVFFEFQLPETRQVALRTSVVLGKHGGALSPLVWLTRFGLGGKLASGLQMFSWIHVEDYFGIVKFLLGKVEIQGVINCTSPFPITNTNFMKTLRNTLNFPFGIPAPEFAIRMVSRFIGTEPELILNSSFVLPKQLMAANYKFKFPSADKALADLLK